jgi:hypothetical protein
LVIIPAYNEAESISDVITALHNEVADYDIVVVDDGSTDNTSEIVNGLPNVDLIRLPYNMGIGSTMQTGYKYAVHNNYDVAVQCDGDGQHPVHQMKSIVDGVLEGKADMIIGSRYVADSDYTPSIFRRIGKSLLSRIVDSAVGGGVTDTTSGFRAMNRSVLTAFANSYPDDYPEAEVLVSLFKQGLKAVEVPVNMMPRQGGESSINSHRALYYIIKVTLAIYISLFKKYPKVHQKTDSDAIPLNEKPESH